MCKFRGGCRNACGSFERLNIKAGVEEFCRSIGGGCADCAESVCEDIEVVGEKESVAILFHSK